MFLARLRRPGRAKAAGLRLYAAAVSEARAPEIYAELGAPDTPDGRFEIYTLYILLLLERLQGEGSGAAAVSQSVFDAYLGGLDHGLRELAVGDLSVGKTMRKLGEAFYGRAQAWRAGVEKLPDRAALEAFLRRAALPDAPPQAPSALLDRLLQARERLAATPVERVIEGNCGWAAP